MNSALKKLLTILLIDQKILISYTVSENSEKSQCPQSQMIKELKSIDQNDRFLKNNLAI